jgi:hypothetical protein
VSEKLAIQTDTGIRKELEKMMCQIRPTTTNYYLVLSLVRSRRTLSTMVLTLTTVAKVGYGTNELGGHRKGVFRPLGQTSNVHHL